MNPETIAKLAHEVFKTYCDVAGISTFPHWSDAPTTVKNDVRGAIKFFLKNRKASPSDFHQLWFENARAKGWIHGSVVEPGNKRHPNVTPWANLPFPQQLRLHFFKVIANSVPERAKED